LNFVSFGVPEEDKGENNDWEEEILASLGEKDKVPV
jgi:hypothetical protein